MNNAKLEMHKKRIKDQLDGHLFGCEPLHEMDVNKMSTRQMVKEIQMWRRAKLFNQADELGAIMCLLNKCHGRMK